MRMLVTEKTDRKMSYWYGARSLREMFYVDDFDTLQAENDNFEWHVALSEPLPEDNWEGATGFIHEVVRDKYLLNHPAPEECEYYLCGPPMMNKAVLKMLDDLGGDPDEPTGEYALLKYSDWVTCGLVPGTDLAWSQCSNELHLYHAETCRPFAVLPLDGTVFGVLPRIDGTEIITVTASGRCQRWPIDPVAVARRKTVEGINAETLRLYGVGTPEERADRERERLLASPSPKGMERIAKAALANGDVDLALDDYGRTCDFGPLGVEYAGIHRRHLELLCRRYGELAPDDPTRAKLVEAALEPIRGVLRLDQLDRVRKYEHFDELEAEPSVRALIGESLQ